MLHFESANEGSIRFNNDTMFCAEFGDVCARVERMDFNLIDSREEAWF
jgi:hypothetical protein